MLFYGRGVTSPRADAPLGPAFILGPSPSGHASSRPEACHPHHGERQPEAGSGGAPRAWSWRFQEAGGCSPSARAPCAVSLSSCHRLKRRVLVMVLTFLACAHCVVPDRHLQKQPFQPSARLPRPEPGAPQACLRSFWVRGRRGPAP